MLTFDNNKIGLFKFHILEQFPEIINFVTSRHDPYGNGNNFNIGYSGGTQEECCANRLMLANAIGVQPERFVFQNQIHRNNVYEVAEDDAGAGFYSKDTAIKDTDILVTSQRGICIVTRSADCIPVLLYSPDSQSVAAIHSGREGTYLGVAAKAAKELYHKYGAKYNNMVACIGPGICGKCYEVDLDCASKFLNNNRFPQDTITMIGNKAYLDLKKMIFYDLLTTGLVANNIEISDICTKCSNEMFFSARAGDMQRFCAGIFMR